jgi:hypothetical protein
MRYCPAPRIFHDIDASQPKYNRDQTPATSGLASGPYRGSARASNMSYHEPSTRWRPDAAVSRGVARNFLNFRDILFSFHVCDGFRNIFLKVNELAKITMNRSALK